MHRCLEIDEIVVHIAEAASGGATGVRTVVAMARSCKTLYEPAMTVLWSILPNLSVLLKCLPSEIWFEEGVDTFRRLHFHRHPTIPEWDALLNHSRRVRAIHHRPQQHVDGGRTRTQCSILEGVFEAITSWYLSKGWSYDTDHSLLPNLTILDLELGTTHDIFALKHFPLIVSPNLLSLTIATAQREVAHIFNKEVREAFKMFAQRCRNLQEVIISLWSGASKSPDMLSPLISLPSLRTFKTNGPLMPQDFLHLAQSPYMTKASFELPNSITSAWSHSPLSPRSVFRELQSLHLVLEKPDDGVKIFDYIGTTSLRSLAIDASLGFSTTVQLPLRFVEKIFRAVHMQRGLEELNLVLSPILSHTPKISSATLSILYPLTRLVNVQLFTPLMIDLDDSTIAAMAEAWPSLRSLYVDSAFSEAKESRNTLSSLLSFAENCPHLIHLRLPISTTFPDFDVRQRAKNLNPPRNLHNLQISHDRSIDLCWDMYRAMYDYLTDLFPQLVVIEFNTFSGRETEGWRNFRTFIDQLLREKLKTVDVACSDQEPEELPTWRRTPIPQFECANSLSRLRQYV